MPRPEEGEAPAPRDDDPAHELIRRTRAGDASALDELLRRIEHRSAGRAARSLGPGLRGRTRASDILQDAYLEVVRRIGEFRGDTEASFASWVGAIVDSSARQQHRHLNAQKRRPPSRPSGLENLSRAIRPEPVSPSANARRVESMTRYTRALELLSEDQRAVIEMVVLQGHAVSDVARELGKSAQAVHSLLSRARAKLALRLQKQRDSDGL